MRNKRFTRILIVFVLLAVLIPSVYAYMIHKSQTVANNSVPGKVTCDIEEAYNGTTKSSIKVKNTGNVDAYIRVRLVFHWEDSKGNVVARNMTTPTVSYDNTKWIKDTADGFTYYYTGRVAPNEFTPEFLSNNFTMEPVVVDVNGTDYTYYPVMEVLAEAIQADGKIDDNPAVTDAWGVTVGANGIITAVK